MKQIQTVEDVYPAIEDLIAELRAANQPKLAAILDHRLHQVAWTTRSELFEELQKIFTNALQFDVLNLPELVRNQMQRILQVINEYLKESET